MVAINMPVASAISFAGHSAAILDNFTMDL